ncbi:hypothetical protein [Sphingomonas trueperi]|uniref:Phage-Barnase-EndoU-ColicinE5/D-RelE-like nuclease domain-containing protein n=1 Tax=Sphingomonas trueperi TaxID=53317 RepID=A0A7X5Y2G0_9SPHN|nr:hypothetical protein [Sphingomonas trueperi]NJB99863.1 hypothetical protein [Sphingomonas trueperi]
MSDLRGGPTPAPAPAPGPDRTSFYSSDPNALPAAKGPADMPQPGWWEAAAAGWQLARDDWAGYRDQKVMDSYSPIIEALQAETGKSANRYYWVGHNTAGVNDVNVFADLAEVRRRKPDFLAGVPGDPDAFGKQVDEREAKRRAADRVTVSRDRGWGSTIGGFAAGAADPWNLATLPLGGGGGATVARRILSEALVNAATEAVEQPLIAAERAKRGEALTAGEAAANIGMAGVAGAGMQGLILEPLGALAKRVIGRDRMTPDEVAAAHVDERQADIAATSPFGAGSGAEVHAERLQAAISSILDSSAPSARARALSGTSLGSAPTPAPLDPLVVPRETSAVPREQLKAKIAVAESGGNDLAANPNSSALGRYQFVAPTWLRYYEQRFGRQGLSDEAILAKRRDPQLQEQLMNDMVADNSAALRRLGAPETAGNLYLMHFAGQGGAGKILRAAPNTPIEQLLSKAAIDANPFLRGKSAADVIEWAHARMGDKGDGATVPREQFASDEEWQAAQRAADAANAEAASWAREREAAPQMEVDFGTRLASEDADVPVRGMDWEPAAAPVRDRGASLVEARRAMEAGQMQEAPGLLWHSETGDIDVRWGVPGDPARAYKGGYGLSHILAKHPEMGDILDRLPELLRDMTVKQRRAERLVLESADHEASIALTWHGDDQTWLLTAYEKPRPDPNSERGSGGSAAVSPRAGAQRDIRAAPADDKMAALEQQWAAAAAQGLTPEPVWAIRNRDTGELVGWSRDRADAEAQLVQRSDNLDLEQIRPPERSAGVPVERELSAKAFDDPAGREAEAQVQSIEHDLRAELARQSAAEEGAGLASLDPAELHFVLREEALTELEQRLSDIARERYPADTGTDRLLRQQFAEGYRAAFGEKDYLKRVRDSEASIAGYEVGTAEVRAWIAEHRSTNSEFAGVAQEMYLDLEGQPVTLRQLLADLDADAAEIDNIRGCL